MNKTIKLAVAGAVLSAASIANAGIIIPAGEWTLDINGNVNAFANVANYDDATGNTITGGLTGAKDATGEDTQVGINTGLLPAWLGFTGTTRQNDLDVSWTISFQPNVSDNAAAGDDSTPKNRQAFVTFGDKSWGSVKLGKDLGIFAGDAILNDMTLLGVGAAATYGSGNKTSLGGIGFGYIYPAWHGQVAYTTPNMNGFQATIGITNPTQISNAGAGQANYSDSFALQAKASYTFAMGKIWVSGLSSDNNGDAVKYDTSALDIGAALSFGNLGVTGYYYSGDGLGTTFMGAQGVTASGDERDSDGGYVQATYVIPSGTKLGVAYGVSRLDQGNGDATTLLDENNRWTVGAYHPLTKHLNLVAEYNAIESKNHAGATNEANAVSLGAILFF